MPKFTEFDPQTGVKTTVHDLGNKIVFEKEYDAQPFLERAADMRAATEGQRWGEMRHIGFIPNAVLGTFMRQDGGIDTKRLLAWIKANPNMATFSKVLK